MALSTAQVKVLDNMCAGAQACALGTKLSGLGVNGAYTVTGADVTATKSVIPTGLSQIHGMIVMVVRSSIAMPSIKVSIDSNTNIKLESNSSTYVLTAGDIAYWIAW